jgi:hypothetical protein
MKSVHAWQKRKYKRLKNQKLMKKPFLVKIVLTGGMQ